MLLKPNKLHSLTTSYGPISLMSSIMKLFEWVIEQRLRSYLEDIGFTNKYQSGFRQAKSTNDHLLRLLQSVVESFNRGEHVVAAFLDAEKAFDNAWHNGPRSSYSSRPLSRNSEPILKLYDERVKVYLQVTFLESLLTPNSLSENTLRKSWDTVTPGITVSYF